MFQKTLSRHYASPYPMGSHQHLNDELHSNKDQQVNSKGCGDTEKTEDAQRNNVQWLEQSLQKKKKGAVGMNHIVQLDFAS